LLATDSSRRSVAAVPVEDSVAAHRRLDWLRRQQLGPTGPGVVDPWLDELVEALALVIAMSDVAHASGDPTSSSASWLTVSACARLLGKSAPTVRRWCAAGRFPGAVLHSNGWMVSIDDVQAMNKELTNG
jgi:helix-turn-helix protein